MTPALEAQERAARQSRKQLALARCDCGECTEKSIGSCDACDHLQPKCLLRSETETSGGDATVCSILAAPEGCAR